MSSNTIFNGSSRYSTDFQAVIDRSVAIASLSLTPLQAQRADLQSQSSALSAVDSKFGALQSAANQLDAALGASSLRASVSSADLAAVTLSAGAVEANYKLEVIDIGAVSTAMSKRAGASAPGVLKVTDPGKTTIAAGSSFYLDVDGAETPALVRPSGTTLNALVEAINVAKLNVHATAVNVGSPSDPDYRLSIASTKYDDVSLGLTDQDGHSLLDPPDLGNAVEYSVNGSTPVTANTRTIVLAPGVTLDLTGENEDAPATISVTRSTDAIATALASFVNAYNAAAAEVDSHRGEKPGALAGQSIIFTLSNTLSDLTGYTAAGGTFGSLRDLGISLDKGGMLSFDTAAFRVSVAGHLDELDTFLGNTKTGGYLKSTLDSLVSLEDSDKGAVKTQSRILSDEITAQDKKIEEEQQRIENLRTALTQQMSAADALIASLEQQVTYITGMFESMRVASQGYN
jgi:flagellar hook-associated protein 2